MYTIKSIALLALAGSAVAAPSRWNSWSGNNDSDNSNVDVQTDVAMVTAYTTVYAKGNWNGHQAQATATAEAKKQQQASVTQEAQQPQETDSSDSSDSQTWQAWSSSSAAAQPSAAAGSSSGTGYMSVVSEWRQKMGMSDLQEDSTLAANALKTAVDGHGSMVHQLNPGSMGQVLAPGSESDFESCFVGGWLCEIPSLPGLDGVCSTESKGWSYDTTGHAELLTSTKYSKIGCGWSDNIWACDLA